MARPNMMGFKPVESIPTSRVKKGRSIYLPMLKSVERSGMTYAFDTNDRKRMLSLSVQLRKIIKDNDLPLKIVTRDTTIYITKEEEDAS